MQSIKTPSVISSLIIGSENNDCDGPDTCREAKPRHTTGNIGAEPNPGKDLRENVIKKSTWNLWMADEIGRFWRRTGGCSRKTARRDGPGIRVNSKR